MEVNDRMDHTIIHFEIPAVDIEKLKQFYAGLFGWKIVKYLGPMEYWMIQTVPTDESIKKVKQLGGKIITPKQEVTNVGWIATAADPEGNQIALLQPQRM
jgi:predicted enzyme related to lactoylglutathione lyase